MIISLNVTRYFLLPTVPLRFESKRKVEDHIRSLPDLGWTFLRFVQFMDNYLPTAPFFLKIGRTVTLKYTLTTHPECLHQLISAKDIGRVGAKAFVDGPTWLGGVVRLAGDREVSWTRVPAGRLDQHH